MTKVKFLKKEEIELNLKKISNFMEKEGLDAFYLSSSDIFLNEYVPLSDCHRYYFTGFTGSTAEALALLDGSVLLFVDGRYHEQADLECHFPFIEIIKCPFNLSIRTALINKISERKIKKLGIEGDRTDLTLFNEFNKVTAVKSFNSGELLKVVQFESEEVNKKIIELPLSMVGESTSAKLARIVKDGEAIFLSALDSIAWLTNLRRYELPSQSTFRSKALITKETVYLLMEEIEGEVTNENIEIFKGSFSKLEDFFNEISFYEEHVKKILGKKSYEIEKIYYAGPSCNVADLIKLKNYFGEEKLVNDVNGIIPYHAIKNEGELNSFRSSFDKADKAIFETISWVQNEVKKGTSFSELDFYYKANEFYKKNGAFDQSFKTISAYGANSSIVHFSNPSNDIKILKDELMLLDSGGYFESGYATDTTRSFLSGGVANAKQKEIYTIVLKALLQCLNAVFPDGTIGAMIDGITRGVMYRYGHNYSHGTGHGVGINVHEAGFRISPTSQVPLRENSVGSMEPGIYIPGFGGVRLENVSIVKKHPKYDGMLCFETLTYIGFDHNLINMDLLSDEEKNWLENYERECEKRGRSFKYNS